MRHCTAFRNPQGGTNTVHIIFQQNDPRIFIQLYKTNWTWSDHGVELDATVTIDRTRNADGWPRLQQNLATE